MDVVLPVQPALIEGRGTRLLRRLRQLESNPTARRVVVLVVLVVLAFLGVWWGRALNHVMHVTAQTRTRLGRDAYKEWRLHRRMKQPLDPRDDRPVLWMAYGPGPGGVTGPGVSSSDVLPVKVLAALDIYAAEYDIRIVSDAQCLDMVEKLEGPAAVKRYKQFRRGAHKADLWRYIVLYNMGGTYMDIKTVLVRPLAEMFPPSDTRCRATLSTHPGTIFNGIIHVDQPGMPIFRELIQQIIVTPEKYLKRRYGAFTEQFYSVLHNTSDVAPDAPLTPGPVPGTRWVLWQEKCLQRGDAGCMFPDRYSFCCHIESADGDLIAVTRFWDYPFTEWHKW